MSGGLLRGVHPCRCAPRVADPRLIAVTGGPGAGKTAVLEMARLAACAHVVVLPEAAGVLFGGGFPRLTEDGARRCAQRAMFHVQRQLERLVSELADVHAVLCDRGTLDGLAYWPGSADAWCADLGTSVTAEQNRYAAVLHLHPPDDAHGYNHDNALRTESSAEARRIDDRIRAAWHGHPAVHHVDSADDFMAKATDALAILRTVLPPGCTA